MSLKAALNCDDVVVVHETSETIKEPEAALIETNTDIKVGQMCTNIQFYYWGFMRKFPTTRHYLWECWSFTLSSRKKCVRVENALERPRTRRSL